MTGGTLITNTLQHSCSKQDKCDRHFAHTHIKWFVEKNDSQLQKAIEPLIVHENPTTGKVIIFNKSKSTVIIVFIVRISYFLLICLNIFTHENVQYSLQMNVSVESDCSNQNLFEKIHFYLRIIVNDCIL